MQDEQKRMFGSLLVPGIFVALMWLVKIFEVIINVDLEGFGIHP